MSKSTSTRRAAALALRRSPFLQYLPMLDTLHDAVWLICEEAEGTGNLFLGAVCGDIGATRAAIEALAPDIFVDALQDDLARVQRDAERMGIREGQAVAQLLRLVLDRLEAAA